MLPGQDRVQEQRRALEWADFLMVGLSTHLLGAEGWERHQPDLLTRLVQDGRCVPVLLHPLPEPCELRCFTDRVLIAPPFVGLGPPKRVQLAQDVAAKLHKVIDDCPVPRSHEDAVTATVRGETPDLARIDKPLRLTPTATRGFAAGDRAADIDDVDQFLLDRALDPGTPLLALLGDSGIGKRSARSGWYARCGTGRVGQGAYYFDLRDVDAERWATRVVLTCRTHYFTDVDSQIGHFRDQHRGQVRGEDYTALALLPVQPEQVTTYLATVTGWPTGRVVDFLDSIAVGPHA